MFHRNPFCLQQVINKKYFLGKCFCNFAMEFYTATWYTVTKNETNPKKGRKDTCRYYTRAQEAKAKQ